MKRVSSQLKRLTGTSLAIIIVTMFSIVQTLAAETGYEIKSATFAVAAGSLTGSSVFCSAGKKVLGGGFDIQDGPQNMISHVHSYATRSEPAQTQNGWNVNVHNPGIGSVKVKIYAICAQ